MNPFGELENALGEQAYRAFIELVFPGQIESDGITNSPSQYKATDYAQYALDLV